MANQKRNIYCPHYYTELKKKGCYFYDIIGMTLWMCDKCNQKLYKEVTKQKFLEDNVIKSSLIDVALKDD